MLQDQHTDSSLTISRIRRPLRLVTVSDRAMEPKLYPGQQVFVQAYYPREVNYFAGLFAIERDGRVIIRHMQQMGGFVWYFWGADPENKTRYIAPDEWTAYQRENGSPCYDTGKIGPDYARLLGKVLQGYRKEPFTGRRIYEPITAGWSN